MLTPASIPVFAGALPCPADFPWSTLVKPEWRMRVCQQVAGGESGSGDGFYHEPVLLNEVLEVLEPAPGKVFVDGTLGGGGHSEALLSAGAQVVGLDRDEDALAFAGHRLERFGKSFRSEHTEYTRMPEFVKEGEIDGVLLDLGVSSWQLDAAQRGFSFQKDGPLDMRMDRSRGETASEVVNGYAEAELSELFWKFGEEKASRKIARAIVSRRESRPFETTLDLARCVEEAMGGRGRKHPATRVFQALRMQVNSELQQVEDGLRAALRVLRPGGVLAVITFHSLEDRLVKRFLRDASRRFLDRPEWPAPRRNEDHTLDLIQRKAVTGTAEELARNPRARSAKLRAAKRV